MVQSTILRSGSLAVLGLGTTGLSCVRYLRQQGYAVTVFDTRTCPPEAERCRQEFPEVQIILGELKAEALQCFDELVVSPGLSIQENPLAALKAAGHSIIGDIELFVRQAQAPIVAITGSNAKSTVTTLLGEMAAEAGVRVAVGGNLGLPALELLAPAVELYVLELSSFQLETTHALQAKVATILNISEDHLDRYTSMQAYHQTKQRIYRNAHSAVYNRKDPLTAPLLPAQVPVQSFASDVPSLGQWGIGTEAGQQWLMHGRDKILAVSQLRIKGQHNALNALAALAIGTLAGLPLAAMQTTLKKFAGLEHRCQEVRTLEAVTYYDDSKGTNVGATVAAIAGLAAAGHSGIVIILGGIGKGQDFAPLTEPIRQHGRAVVLMGVDAPLIAAVLPAEVPVYWMSGMQKAVQCAQQQARPGDAVLLSPACSSFDMFKDYHDRGRQFVQAVEALR